MEAALGAHGAQVLAVAQSGTVELLDCRLPSEVSKANRDALEQFRLRAAPFFAAIRDGAEEYGAELRAELNELAGGEAPASVMALAKAAVDAHTNCQLAQHILGHATGDLETLKASKQAGRRLEITQLQRTAMGLDVAFTDLVRRATEAARAEGKAKQAKLEPVDALMATLGVPGPAGEGSTSVPDLMGGVGAVGAPLSPNPAPSFGPLSQPKPTPASPALNLDPASPSVFAAPLPKKPPRRKQEP